jgi:hypothetical protein
VCVCVCVCDCELAHRWPLFRDPLREGLCVFMCKNMVVVVVVMWCYHDQLGVCARARVCVCVCVCENMVVVMMVVCVV